MFGCIKKLHPKPPKQYPPLTLAFERESVRMFRHTLRIAYPTKLITAHVKDMLLTLLETSIKASEAASGIRCPYGLIDDKGFDKHALPFIIELCDIEQFALKRMLVQELKNYDVVRRVPNRELLGDVYLALDKHIIMNGGYDHSTSPENLSRLDKESKRIKRYIRLKKLKSLFTL